MDLKKWLLTAGFVLQGLGVYWLLTALYNVSWVAWYPIGGWRTDFVGPIADLEILSKVTTSMIWALLSIILAAALFAVVHFMNRQRRAAGSQ